LKNMIDLPLRVLRYFVAAAERGNVTEAARELNVSQPSVSLAIARMEGALGVELFVRQHARGVALTPAGSEVLLEARKLLSQASDFLLAASSVGQALRGTLSIGCLSYLVPSFLPAILKGFLDLHPEIDVSFREGDQDTLQAALANGEIEIAITYDLLLARRFTVRQLLELPPYLLLPERHRLARRPYVTLRDVAAEPCVLLDLPISREYFASVFGAVDLKPLVRYRTASVEAVRSFVGNGLGYSVLNHPSRTGTTYDGRRTRVVGLSDALPPARIAAVHLAEHKLRAIAQAFLSHAACFFEAWSGIRA
jgi:DNA-binding transcriptional LysR family regulator